jgi:putative two-component system response regulator
MAIADVYDALVSERPYKKAFSHDKSVEIIKKDSGTHFDPKIVEVFLSVTDDFRMESVASN